ncbi:hypothetical protein N7495_009888 [Penicillium taxi]|uniref:uncharacterized protein n=1 Tax=Penicillium taxi TaxID=168475 RepID=UPI0025452CB5|nr:uncharacterized protein N7495_009888 [Penicillium taxi]KAJ5885378.1 hypothetical protein N7495_009888 [Penicillium taxi]
MPTARAKLGDIILAETDTWETVEGNVYFPPSAIKDQNTFVKTDTKTFCPWKGEAEYYTINAGDFSIPDAAWYYSRPFDKAANIKDHIAFYCLVNNFMGISQAGDLPFQSRTVVRQTFFLHSHIRRPLALALFR